MAPKSIKSTGGASKEYFSESEYGVSASPRVASASAKDLPEGGGRYHVGKPYKIKGKTYRPKEDPDYSKVGIASWYGSAFHGRKTANGEIYDMGELTAAHPTLPLPSYVRVTNVANNRSVVVRVNDRGPFKQGRIIDVSSAAADMLDFKRAGTAKVKVEYVGRARLDGRDRQMLVASYRGPNDFGGDTLFAAKPTSGARNITLASLSPFNSSRRNPKQDAAPVTEQNLSGAPILAPAFMPASATGSDQLGPLILQSGFTSSYAPVARVSRAHAAASELAQRGKSTSVIQIGAYANSANAERVAQLFDRYGKIVTNETTQSPALFVVRLLADGAGSAETALAAAHAMGMSDAFIVSR